MQGEPAEASLLLLSLSLQHRLIELYSVLIVVVAAVQRYTEDFSSTVHGSHPPHGHAWAQTVKVSARQEVGPQQGVGRRSAGSDVDSSGSAATALCVMVLPGGALEEVQHFEDSLLAVGFMEEEGDGQRRVVWKCNGLNSSKQRKAETIRMASNYGEVCAKLHLNKQHARINFL